MIRQVAPEVLLEVDGGVTLKNIRSIADAGADILVAGSSVFGSGNYAETIGAMKTLLAATSPSRDLKNTGSFPLPLSWFMLIRKTTIKEELPCCRTFF